MDRKMIKKVFAWLLSVAMLLCLLVGCGESGQTNATDGPEQTKSAENDKGTAEDVTDSVSEAGETDGTGSGTKEPESQETETPDSEPLGSAANRVDVAAATGVREVVSAQWDYAGPYSEGFAVVGRTEGERMKYNYIDWDGNLISETWYDLARNFSCGMAVVGVIAVDGSWPQYDCGYLGTDGELAIPLNWRGNGNYHPWDFNPETGLAEVNWLNEDGREVGNLIDKDGNLLLEFNAAKMIGYGDSGDDPRLLSISWGHDYSLLVDFEGEATWLQGEDGIYWVDADGKVLKSQPGEFMDVYELDGGYLCAWGMDGAALFDADGNRVDIENMVSVEAGIGDQWIVTTTDENGNWLMGVYSSDFEMIIPQTACQTVQNTTRWYFFWTEKDGVSVVERYSTDGQWQETIPNGAVCNLSYSAYNEKGNWINTEAACYQVSEGELYLLYNEDGEAVLSSELYFQCIGENLVLVDNGAGAAATICSIETGEVLLELPAEMIPTESYNYTYTPVEYGRVDLAMHDYNADRIAIIHLAIEEDNVGVIGEVEVVPMADGWDSREETLWSNRESYISGIYYYGVDSFKPVSLLNRDGEVIDSADALSLVKDGYYKKGTIVLGEDMWDLTANPITLCKVGDDSFVCPEYENLGLFSEGRIAFYQDGKWGYLELTTE